MPSPLYNVTLDGTTMLVATDSLERFIKFNRREVSMTVHANYEAYYAAVQVPWQPIERVLCGLSTAETLPSSNGWTLYISDRFINDEQSIIFEMVNSQAYDGVDTVTKLSMVVAKAQLTAVAHLWADNCKSEDDANLAAFYDILK